MCVWCVCVRVCGGGGGFLVFLTTPGVCASRRARVHLIGPVPVHRALKTRYCHLMASAHHGLDSPHQLV